VSVGGFFVNVWIGAGTAITGILLCAFGIYVVRIRAAEYVDELKLAHEQLAALRAKAHMRTEVRPAETAPLC
jgi:hypothetical protein